MREVVLLYVTLRPTNLEVLVMGQEERDCGMEVVITKFD